MRKPHLRTREGLTAILALTVTIAAAQEPKLETSVLSIQGTRFLREGKPFHFQGLSFFNALCNREFNKSPLSRERWLRQVSFQGV